MGYDVKFVAEDALPEGVGWAAVNDGGHCIVFVKRSICVKECRGCRVLAALRERPRPRPLAC